jgi:hypothetical protein
MPDDKKEPWVPQGPEDWADVFASGIAKDRANREEAEAKAKAAQGDGKPEGGDGDTGDSKPKSWRERLLG